MYLEKVQKLGIIDVTDTYQDVRSNSAYVVITGAKHDGVQFVSEAIKRGAKLIISDNLDLVSDLNSQFSVRYGGIEAVYTKRSRQALSRLVSYFHPKQPTNLIAVTGTNGKTSTVYFYAQLAGYCTGKGACIGTLGAIQWNGGVYRNMSKVYNGQYSNSGTGGRDCMFSDKSAEGVFNSDNEVLNDSDNETLNSYYTDHTTFNQSNLTTPHPLILHKMLQTLSRNGYDHVALEISSHGLCQYRADGVRLKAAGFTNLSRDHLDYHHNMEDYFMNKQRLFAELLANDGIAVLNADVAEYDILRDICNKRGIRVIDYGFNAHFLRLLRRPDSAGIKLKIENEDKYIDLTKSEYHEDPYFSLIQVQNLLCSIGFGIATGLSIERMLAAVPLLKMPPGRMQRITVYDVTAAHENHNIQHNANKAECNAISADERTNVVIDKRVVYIDYAHSPDALENALFVLSEEARKNNGMLGVVFGCGGERDNGKRKIMGQIAVKIANFVIVTDDNPRNEDPANIRKEIISGCNIQRNANYNIMESIGGYAAGNTWENMPQYMTHGFATIEEIGDRAKAIFEGIRKMHCNDVLLIAGKGHDQYQIIKNRYVPFSDEEHAKAALRIYSIGSRQL